MLITIIFIVSVLCGLIFAVVDCIKYPSVAKKEFFTVALLSLIPLGYLLATCLENF
jgi:uncharacterized membrane protein YwzB